MPANNRHAKLRHGARLSAIQALYQMDISQEPSATVIKEFLNHRIGEGEDCIPADMEFFADLVSGVVREQVRIDQEIAKHLSEKWSLKRLDLTLRAVMRSAAYEVMQRSDVPALVIIDQYVSITSDFYDGKEPNFVNAALDGLAKKVRAAEFGLTGSSDNSAAGNG